MKCTLCEDVLSFLKCVSVDNKRYICFSCVQYINALVADKCKQQGWQITADALVSKGKESA